MVPLTYHPVTNAFLTVCPVGDAVNRACCGRRPACGDGGCKQRGTPGTVGVAHPTHLSRELTDSSLPKIGKQFGGRDHTTVIHATSKIARLIREDRSVYNLVQELTARIKQLR